MTPPSSAADSVLKTIQVKASQERAFRVFTEEFDSWWPRSHHVGKSPMVKSVIEGRVGGRCYAEQEDGADCVWGSILAWEPPRRFVLAWRIDANWQLESDMSKCSEVEVNFTPEADGYTRVDLEHRYFSRMGASGETVRAAVDSKGGWGMLLELFASRVGEVAQ